MAKRIELSKYKKRSDFRSGITVLAHLAVVLSPVYLAAYSGPGPWWLLLGAAFGFLMNGLLNLMHECSHYHVFASRAGADILGRWVLGPLAIADFDGYRERHWKHHTHFGIDGDTKDAYLVDIHGAKLATFLLRCLVLWEALGKFRHQTTEDPSKPKDSSQFPIWLARVAIFQVLLFVSLLLIAGPAAARPWPKAFVVASLAYGLVYAYGLASLTVFAATLRAIAEHQLEAGQIPSPRRGALRNFKCGPISWLVFGAYGFAEHGTHHCEPSLPYYHLPQATVELAADDPELVPARGYLAELAALAAPASRPASQAAEH
ncbi:MAG TPA: fatty acid desaturase [Candidatus Acidoferrales bacterium]|nr:fatty acid desaturase [Candidatus Acidoferrales bacterium]